MKIIFFGSDAFAVAHLERLIASAHEVTACVTQPDRPKGRGMKVVISPVKAIAQGRGIPALQPSSINDKAFAKTLEEFYADIFVVIAYGKFLPAKIYEIPPYGAINVHASLLPKYRGAAPINWAVINGEKETGVTVIQINQTMDAGDIIAARKTAIQPDDTAVTLKAKMMETGPPLLIDTLDGLVQKRMCPRAQDHKRATYAPKLNKELGAIQWDKEAESINNLIRGTQPWPGAYTYYQGKMLKILEARVVKGPFTGAEPGEVTALDGGITIAAGKDGLLVKNVHLQDGKPMEASAFVRGHAVSVGFKFG